VRLTRREQQSAVTLSGSITKADTGSVNEEISQIIDGMDLPKDVTVQIGGVIADQTAGFSSLSISLAEAVILDYFIMMAAMGSLLDPLIILITLPLASIGALLSLLITGRPLGMSSMIGMLMLIGIVVTNAIVLLALVRRLRAKGMGIEDALVEAGRTRIRPIIMTAGATVLALVPVALGYDQGSIIAKELSTVVIGGLTTSTLLTLIIIPVVYSILHKFEERRGKKPPEPKESA
jgi:HAE1 family hydrophobic/amphiphilic exporter-1